MNRRWNLLPLAGFLVVLTAFFSYFMIFAYFPLTRDFPWANLLLFAFGFALLGAGLRRAFRQPEAYGGKIGGSVLAVLSVLILTFFLGYNFYLSAQLPASKQAPQVGQKAPDFTLPDHTGAPVTLSAFQADAAAGRPGQWLLLVFYRGYW
jgi:hypothetical protein